MVFFIFVQNLITVQHSVSKQSDQGLRSLSMAYKKDVKLIWVKVSVEMFEILGKVARSL